MPQALLHDVKFNHTVVQMTSPIAFFVVSEAELGIKRLNPVAIQMDYTPDSKVYTPLDGKNWFLAKSFVQRADFNSLHLIEKRLKTHLYLDAPCTLSEKYFSEYHPVYQLLRQHCRAALETNKLFEIKLFGKIFLFFNASLFFESFNIACMLFNNTCMSQALPLRGIYLRDDDKPLRVKV